MAAERISCDGGTEPLAVCIRHVNHYYVEGGLRHQVLFDITLDFRPGEMAVITGPSGSGKSTLLTLIGALRSVQEGSIQINGHELGGLSNQKLVDVRRRIGFIFQAHNLFESLTAFQNTMMTIQLHHYRQKERKVLVTHILTQLGLEDRMHYKPNALSGGQRQRVAIARALVHRPKLILADEPTAALDKDQVHRVVTLLQQSARTDQATVLIVTHDHRILDVADRIVYLADGRINGHTPQREAEV